MNWYLQSTENSDVVKSTRIRFLRNLSEFKFNLNSKEDIEKLENKIKDNLYGIGYGLKFLKLKDMDDITKKSLVEKNLITPEFSLKRSETGSILINEDENICIMIGGKDHLNIQVFSSGLDLENTLNLAIEIDEKIGDTLGYAISKKYGYLTSSPSNIGTGLKASAIVYLPALTKTRNTRKIFDAINSFGMNIKASNSDNNQNQSYIYEISNKQTLGITEKEIVKNLKVIIETCYLTKEEIKEMTKICNETFVNFIKTSTGYGTRGASLEDIDIINEVKNDVLEIKASGGIRTYQEAIKYVEKGVTRIGTSNGVEIMEKN